jgi:HEAT repeat protein
MSQYEKNFTVGRLAFIALVVAAVMAVGSELHATRFFKRAVVELIPPAVHVLSSVQGSDAVSQRITELRDGDPLERRYAAWALGELESTQGVRPLIESLEDRNADVRLVSAWALGEIKDFMAIQPLIERLADDDAFVREMAALSLGEIENPAAVSALVEALDRYPELREPVIWALGEIGGGEMGGGEAASVREEIFAESGRHPYDNDEVFTGHLGSYRARPMADDLSTLTGALQDDDPFTRISAAERLGDKGDERAVNALLDALRDPDPAVRAMAIWALDETNPSRNKHSENTSSGAERRSFSV